MNRLGHYHRNIRFPLEASLSEETTDSKDIEESVANNGRHVNLKSVFGDNSLNETNDSN